jgi:uncharacterized protein
MKYFMDTYAIIEIIKENRNYKKYLNHEFFTSIFNLYELYYVLLRDKGEEMAREYYNQFRQFLIEAGDEDIFKAAGFKLENKKKDISYTDALGYALCSEKGMRFLTGDKEFAGMDNVEFVK